MNPQLTQKDSNETLVVKDTNLKADKKKSGKDSSASEISADSISLDASSYCTNSDTDK